jgi:hypothetical protein
MFTPEFYFYTGALMVIGSLLLLAIAGSVRDWFFQPELRNELQPVMLRRPDKRP